MFSNPLADIVIVTLGLIEAWFDALTGSYLNRMPPKDAVREDPSRLSLHVMDVDKAYPLLDAAFSDAHRPWHEGSADGLAGTSHGHVLGRVRRRRELVLESRSPGLRLPACDQPAGRRLLPELRDRDVEGEDHVHSILEKLKVQRRGEVAWVVRGSGPKG